MDIYIEWTTIGLSLIHISSVVQTPEKEPKFGKYIKFHSGNQNKGNFNPNPKVVLNYENFLTLSPWAISGCQVLRKLGKSVCCLLYTSRCV